MKRPEESPALVHCDMYYDRFDRNVWEEFVSKYSNSIKSIYDLYCLNFGEIESIQSFRNLEIWKLNSHHSMEVENNPGIKDQLKLPNLKYLRFCYCCLDRTFLHQMAEHKNHFGYKLISSNQKITSLNLKNEIKFGRQLNEEPFQELDVFYNLRIESFKACFIFIDNPYNEYEVLSKFTDSLKNVKTLDLYLTFKFNLKHDFSNTISKCLKFFSKLTELEVLTLKLNGNRGAFKHLNCVLFRNCKKLKVLNLNLERINDFYDSYFFHNCGEYLKSIQSLNVKHLKYDHFFMENLKNCKNLTRLYVSGVDQKSYIQCRRNFPSDYLNTNLKSIVITYSDYIFPFVIKK